MHSSRMRTARLLTVFQHALLGGCTCRGMYLPRGVYLPRGGVPARGYLLGGVPTGGVPAQVLPPPVNRITDTCKNITMPQTSFAGGKNVIVDCVRLVKFVTFDTMKYINLESVLQSNSLEIG